MAENTRLKELQADMKKTNEFIEVANGRFDMIEKLLASLSKSMEELNRRQESSSPGYMVGSSMTEPTHVQLVHQYQPLQMKQVKLDFPRFDGTDPLNWLFRAEQFFTYYEIPDAQRLTIAVVHMDGPVVPWFQMLQKAQPIPTWDTLAHAIEEQFGPSKFECARAQLFKLTQQDSVDDYYSQFMSLANRAKGLRDDALLDCFVGGLKPEVRQDVIAHSPTTLLKAVALARLFSERVTFMAPLSRLHTTNASTTPGGTSKNTTTSSQSATTGSTSNAIVMGGKSSLPPLLPTPTHLPPIKRISPTEMQIRREKGLCYTCDAKFTPSHRCPNKQLMMLQGEDETEDHRPSQIEESVGEPPTLHHLSFHAFRGSQGTATIRFNGVINGTAVQILLDGGSSDNFIHPRIVQHLKLPVEFVPDLKVMVGTGE